MRMSERGEYLIRSPAARGEASRRGIADAAPASRAPATISRASKEERMTTHTTGTTGTNVWAYRDENLATSLKPGYEVEALDGGIGKIDDCSREVGRGHIVVDTGPWIMGKKVLLPASVVDRVDTREEKVYVNRTKDEIKSAPEFDPDRLKDETYRNRFTTYYGNGRNQRF
jgi:hypothetical protein